MKIFKQAVENSIIERRNLTVKNLIVGQSGGPTAVINSSLAGVFKTASDMGIDKVYGMRYGIEGLLRDQYIDLATQLKNVEDIEILKRTPSSFLGSCRYKLPDNAEFGNEIFEKIFDTLNKLNIGYFLYIGGNDSMDTIKKLSEYAKLCGSDIKFIGVPKTIDNDLAETDHTPGFGSAAKYIASVMKEVVRDSLVYDTKSVTIVEIMGRNAGWLAGSAALAKAEDCEGADFIFLPEMVFDIDKAIDSIKNLQKTKKSIVVALSEGVRNADGIYLAEMESSLGAKDSFGHKILTGAARFFAGVISERLGCKTRAIELNTLQRCSAHISSGTDIAEAFMCGGAAVKAAIEGSTGMMVTVKRISDKPYQSITSFFDITKIANIEKKIPDFMIDAENYNVTKEFTDYVRPLIQSEFIPIMIDGLPKHIKIND